MILTREKPVRPMVQPVLIAEGRNWLQPQLCQPSELAALIAEGRAAGFDAVRMLVKDNPIRYVLGFQRQPSTMEVQNENGI